MSPYSFYHDLEEKSIPQIIRTVLKNNRLYLNAIKEGIVNYTSLAEKIKPEVERLTGSKINTGTIVVAIKRFSDKLNLERDKPSYKNKQNNIIKTTTSSKYNENYTRAEVAQYNAIEKIKDARIVLIGNIYDVFIEFEIPSYVSEVIDFIVDTKGTSRISIFPDRINSLHILTEDPNELKIILDKSKTLSDYKINWNLSRIVIHLPDNKNTFKPHIDGYEHLDNNPDLTLEDSQDINKLQLNNTAIKNHLLDNISYILYNSNIRLYDIFFSSSELNLIIDKKDASRAFDILQNNIIE